MQRMDLFRYTREDGGITVSPTMPNEPYTPMYRLIAEEGKELVNGDIRTECVDVDSAEGWLEENKEEAEDA